jgi:3-hydroxybutyryl-CoA dehydratase
LTSTINLSQLFSEQFAELGPGQRFTTPGRTITETDVVNFSAMTGDWHPQHNDAEWASKSFFGERVAHGMLVLSYAVALIPFDHERLVGLRRAEATFKEPVRFGDTIHVEGRVTTKKTIAEEQNLSLMGGVWKVVNQHGKTCVRAHFDIIWRGGDVSTPLAGNGAQPQ